MIDEVSSGIGNRKSPRRAFNSPAGLLLRGNYAVIRALQISEGGMLVEISAQLQRGQELVMSVVLPGGGTVISRAQIVYGKPRNNGGFAYGIQFRELPLPQRRLIRNYVSAKTEHEAEVDEVES